jgi:hypothetical protein
MEDVMGKRRRRGGIGRKCKRRMYVADKRRMYVAESQGCEVGLMSRLITVVHARTASLPGS